MVLLEVVCESLSLNQSKIQPFLSHYLLQDLNPETHSLITVFYSIDSLYSYENYEQLKKIFEERTFKGEE